MGMNKFENYFYFVFRVFLGLLFLEHGAQKLFGWFGGSSVDLVSLMGLAGIIEFFGGLLITLGLFTRITAVITAIEMIVAYFIAHISNGLIPIVNQGELALLYFASFLILISYGSKKWGLDNLLHIKDT